MLCLLRWADQNHGQMLLSNITAAIDIAFIDWADIKAYVGPPTLQARYEILRSCLQELLRAGILAHTPVYHFPDMEFCFLSTKLWYIK